MVWASSSSFGTRRGLRLRRGHRPHVHARGACNSASLWPGSGGSGAGAFCLQHGGRRAAGWSSRVSPCRYRDERAEASEIQRSLQQLIGAQVGSAPGPTSTSKARSSHTEGRGSLHKRPRCRGRVVRVWPGSGAVSPGCRYPSRAPQGDECNFEVKVLPVGRTASPTPCSANQCVPERPSEDGCHNHVRWCWQVAGIWDALIAGRVAEARARCGLLIAAADQASIDARNWVVSNVALLEAPPPYQAFAQHQIPGPLELRHGVIYDHRWAEIFLGHLREVDSFVDAKKKLGSGKGAAKKNSRQQQCRAKSKGEAEGQREGRSRQEMPRKLRSGGWELEPCVMEPMNLPEGAGSGGIEADLHRSSRIHAPGSAASTVSGCGVLHI